VAHETSGPPAQKTTGHDWDGITEYDRPTPKWWLWVLYATILWSVAYWIAMPAWPLVSGYTRGLLGYSQRQELAAEMAASRATQEKYRALVREAPLDRILADPEMQEFALAGGRSAFAVNCSQCHGQGAEGSKGFPNLNDDDWLWGGTLADIERSIRFGIRSGHAEARESQMPAFLKDQLLKPAQIADVAEFVLALSDRATDRAAATRGRAIFAENCASCHGENGQGNPEVGAPSVRDAIWLFGGDKRSIVASISNPARGVMPAWEGRLDPVTIKVLTVYVHSLGGGK
jgi:cytochrome c oxidase cbb3-type subunit 3